MCGHGFYQFSPELFFNTLSEEDGFEVEQMVLHPVGPYGRWYDVSDPRKIKARVELVTLCPVLMLVRAKRISVVPIFAHPPQPSDYTVRWEDPNQPGGRANPFTASRPGLARALPGLARLLNVLKTGLVLARNQTIWNRRSFRPIAKP